MNRDRNIEDGMGFAGLAPCSDEATITYERLRYLEGVERLARKLVTSGLELRGNPPALTVIERADHMDPHWLLCTILHTFPKPTS